MNRGRFAFVIALLLALAVPAWAAGAGSFSFQSTIAADLSDSESKLVQLAEAMPQEKYGWRPAEGVRSFAEVLLHVAADNYFIGTLVGAKMPEGIDVEKMEKSTQDKTKIIAQLKTSFAFAREVTKGVPDAELAATVKVFGHDSTKANVLLVYATHAHEHLGQEIAYVRSVGVTPPWSKGM